MPRCPATKTRLAFQLKREFLPLATSRLAISEIAGHHLLDELRRTSSSASSRAFRAPCWRRRSADRPRSGGSRRGSMRTTVLPDLLSTPVSSTPLPRHSMPRPTSAKASSTNSRTERVSPVASTKSSGASCLQDPLHALDVVARMAPVALGVEIAEIERVLAGRSRCAATPRVILRVTKVSPRIGLSWLNRMPLRGVHAVGLAVVHRDPVAVELGDAVGRARIERRRLASAALPAPGRTAPRSRPDRSASSSPCRGCGSLPAAAARRCASALAVYSGLSKLTPTWLCAARL